MYLNINVDVDAPKKKNCMKVATLLLNQIFLGAQTGDMVPSYIFISYLENLH
jgi:hypothetical protein